jgi:NitT/TauT family transport system permease protein
MSAVVAQQIAAATVRVNPSKTIASRIRGAVPAALVFVGFVCLWYLVRMFVMTDRNRFLLPTPHAVLQKSFGNETARNELFKGLSSTAQVALIGFAISCVLAIVFSTIMALSRAIESAFFPYAVLIQTIPVLAVTPLIKNWFGPTRTSRIVVAVLVSIFPILTSFLFGLKSVERGHLELFRLHGAGWWTRLRKLQLPAALPSIFTGMRIGAGLCVIGALVADFFLTRGELGLGRLLNNYAKELEYERLFGGIILAALLGVTIYAVIGWISNRVLRNWHDTEAGS